MSLNPIYSVTDFNAALDAISSRTPSTPQQRESILKELESLQERLDFLLCNGKEIQITDLVGCQMRLARVCSAFKRGIQPLGSSTALTLSNPQQDAAPVQAIPSIFILPAECMLLIFSRAIENLSEPIVLGTLSLVCKGWQTLTSDNVLWKPVFNRYIRNTTYDINHSPVTSFKHKIILLKETRLTDFEKIILECIKEESTSTDSIQTLAELTRLGPKRFLNEYDLTELINFLINNKHIESAAKLLLFKPPIDSKKVFRKIIAIQNYSARLPIFNNYEFIEQLMIKLGYKSRVISSIIASDTFISATAMLTSFIQLKVNGLKISDYIASGYRFNGGARVLFPITEACHLLFYSTGTFESPTDLNDSDPVSFSDEKLEKYIRKRPFSEEDLKEFILDLLTKVGFNLDEIYPETDYFNFKEGTLLSQFRQLVDTVHFPKPNAFSKALAEYDQMQAEKL